MAIKSFILALQFLTIISVAPGLKATRQELCASLAFFPLIGLILGAILSALFWAASPLLDPEPLAALLTVSLAFLTRSLHLDGLCDTADAIGSGAGRKRALEIMKDSAAGSLGVVALVSVLLLKTGALVSLCRLSAWQLIILAPCLSRWSLNGLASMSSYARKEQGLGSSFCDTKSRANMAIAALTTLAASWFLLHFEGMLLFLAATSMSFFSALFFKSRFGGVTGDCLGAHLESVETIILIAGAAMTKWIG